MSPSDREREYAKRRYEKWAAKHEERQAAQRRVRRNGYAALASVVGVLLIVGLVTMFARGDDPAPAATALTPAATPSGSGSASPSPSASKDPNNPCPAPPAQETGTPADYDAPDASLAEGKTWKLAFETSCGPITITLDGAKAPKAVASTIFLARKNFWDNTKCHRLTTEGIFVLQCGDPTGTGTGGPGYEYGPVENAPKDDVYPAGTVAMARQGNKGDSMGSQFFLVYKDSTIPSDSAGGYTVVGKIVGGLDTVQKIAAGGVEGGADGAPKRAVSLLSATVTPG